MKKNILILVLTCIAYTSFSQIHEVGVFLGGSNFIGDVGSTNYIYPNEVSGGLVYKYNLNPRIALRGTYTYLSLSGNDANSGNSFRESRGFNFSNKIHEFAAGIEYNFFDYNIRNPEQSFTPYILTEIAVMNYKKPKALINSGRDILLENTFSVAIPLGVGIKGRISDHLAYGFEAAVRLTFTDDIDFSSEIVTDRIPNFSPGNGNDFYTFTAFSLVYTFGRPPCYAERE
ncbi:DUF6089 family protein [Tenacibaculum sp. M341]|uniref:type IX secretion system protein PorG n=1 Tax=Tenacibaculum sp. M341 TaxID=2530339 RepID=UPI001042E724|nr:DUF6089 family protein [Tenacibaculum sp. M341]TCI93767.1 hypothetical protein EYW44_04960 [Tenacibaculum sp. M341]